MLSRILCRCWWRRFYYRLYKILMLPVRSIVGGINIEDQVVATLRKDGKVIRRIVGVRMHNKWKSGNNEGLEAIKNLLRAGGSGTTPGKVLNMLLGSQCSDTAWTLISGTSETTINNTVSDVAVSFLADWASAGAISNICQAMIQMNNYVGGLTDAAIYNFGTQFDKIDGVSLEITWTATMSSA